MSELRELAERWFVKAHRLEEDRCFPAGFERRMCANELLAALEAAEMPTKPEVCVWCEPDGTFKNSEPEVCRCKLPTVDWACSNTAHSVCRCCGRKIEVTP